MHLLEVKIKFTFDSLPKLFREIEMKYAENIGKIFGLASEKMEVVTPEKAWEEAINELSTNLTQKDKDILKDLGKLLGQTDIDGQISQIKLVSNFLDIQIEEANKEKMKNQKLYRTLRNGGGSCYSYNIGLESRYLFNKLIKK